MCFPVICPFFCHALRGFGWGRGGFFTWRLWFRKPGTFCEKTGRFMAMFVSMVAADAYVYVYIVYIYIIYIIIYIYSIRYNESVARSYPAFFRYHAGNHGLAAMNLIVLCFRCVWLGCFIFNWRNIIPCLKVFLSWQLSQASHVFVWSDPAINEQGYEES